MAARAPVSQREVRRPTLFARLLRCLFRFLSMLVLALCVSILLEWIGMALFWPEQGVRHSEQMLAQELDYLNTRFKRSLVAAEPVVLAQRVSNQFSNALDSIGLHRLIEWLRLPESGDGALALVHDLLQGFRRYLEAMTNTSQTIVVRLMVLTLATPAFVLFGLVGFAEGLMRRDLRRWGGGRESSFLYHHTKKLLGPSIAFAWMVYLAAPFTIHPNLVLLPAATLFAVSVAVTTATFKKYI